VSEPSPVARSTFAIGGAAAVVVALLGGVLTDIGPWYYSLRQPPWKPPDWAFGPIWTVIFTTTVIAGARAWTLATPRERGHLVQLFALNGVLNVLWSALFFRFQRPDWALVEVFALWLSVLALVLYSLPIHRLSAWLLTPYLIWVSIAAALNYEVVRLNPLG
jgi:translocator protein